MSSTMLCLIPKNLFSNELTFSFSETVALRSKMGLVSPSICKLKWIFKRTEQRKGDRNVLWAVSCHSSFLWQLQRGNREAGGSVFVCLFSIFDWTILAPKNNNTWNWYGTNVTLYSGFFPGGIFLSVWCHFFTTLMADYDHFLHSNTLFNWLPCWIMSAGLGKSKFWTSCPKVPNHNIGWVGAFALMLKTGHRWRCCSLTLLL